ncbi:MAG: large subunit ribosomal protein L4 [Parcubacteria group bacterium Athens0714_16]|nr:MAG: large subunit ribosomal protein L4 [Parcubacteria group bacterium Athens0714_16]
MEVKVYNQKGEEKGKIKIPASIFGVKWNADLIYQVATSMMSNARKAIAHTKNRGDVRGGGIKPWRQKGTGKARHGSSRSPIWKGGGVTFGPRNERDFSKKINKKMKVKALFTLLSQKLKDGELLFVDSIKFSEPKAKEAKSILSNLSKISGFEKILSKKNNSVLIILGKNNINTTKSFNNFNNTEIINVKSLSSVDLLKYKHIVITEPEESVAFIEGKKL